MKPRVPETLELLWEKVRTMGQPGRVLIPEGALVESVAGPKLLESATFDDGSRTIRDVTLITVGWSLNGRYYTPEALRGSANLFNKRKSYLNHEMWSYSRDMRDLCGSFSGLYFDEAAQALKGHLRVFASTPNAWVYDLAKEDATQVGLSVVIEGQTQTGVAPDGRTGPLVQSILVAHSCDVVPEPAAGGGVDTAREATEREEHPVDLKDATIDQLKKDRPDLYEAIVAQTKPAEKPVADQVAEAVTKALAEQRQQSEAEGAKAKAVETLLEGSGLPKPVQDKLRPLVLKLGEAEAKEAIETQKFLQVEMAAAESRPPVRDAGSEKTDEGTKVAEAKQKISGLMDAAFGVPAPAGKEKTTDG